MGGGNMGAFSTIDIGMRDMRAGRDCGPVTIGGFGVCLLDTGNPPVFWTLETIIADMGVFRQSDNPANIAQFPIANFWQLI